MPHPRPHQHVEPVSLKTFDPVTFYPALAAKEKLHIKSRDDSVTSYPHKSIAEPNIPPNFDPAVFYPALAARDKARGVVARQDSNFTDSIHPSSSISQSGMLKVEGPVRGASTDTEALTKKRFSRRKLWIVGIIVVTVTFIIVFLFAWLGTHDWFT